MDRIILDLISLDDLLMTRSTIPHFFSQCDTIYHTLMIHVERMNAILKDAANVFKTK